MPGLFDVVIKCESSIEAQKAAEFINRRFLIRASWDQNELTMWHGVKHRISYPDFDEEEEEEVQSAEQTPGEAEDGYH